MYIKRPLVTDPYTGQLLGGFRVSAITGLLTGGAANAPIFSCRWTQTLYQAVIESLSVSATITTAFTAAQPVDAEAIIARSFTVADSTGTAITLTGDAQKNDKRQAASLFADMRVAGAGGGLTAGTRTLDGAGIASGVIPQTNALGTGAQIPLIAANPYDAPVCVLSANEGLIVRIPTAQGAAGVVRYYVDLVWREVLNGQY